MVESVAGITSTFPDAKPEGRPERDQLARRGGGHRDRGTRSEDHEADDECHAAPVTIAEPAPDKKQRRKRERVRVDHPHEIRLGCMGHIERGHRGNDRSQREANDGCDHAVA
jgi:hypothetical protein